MSNQQKIISAVIFFGAILLVACSSKPPQKLELPLQITSELRQLYLNTAFPCEGDSPANLKNAFYANDELVLFFTVPNYLCNEHALVTARVDQQNQWHLGGAFEGAVSRIIPYQQGLIMLVHWEIEGSFPAIYFSERDLQWHALSLPEKRKKDCCFDAIEQLAIESNRIKVKFFESEEAPSTSWQASVTNLYSSRSDTQLNWQILPAGQAFNENLNSESIWKKVQIVPVENSTQVKLFVGKKQWLMNLPVFSSSI